MKLKQITLIYFVILVLELVGDFVFANYDLPYMVWLFKPLLMIVLGYWYYNERKGALLKFDKFILAALFFSWLGDVFLMPKLRLGELQLLFGLVPFLIAHLLYIFAFAKKGKGKSILLRRPHLIIPFLFLEFGLVSMLMNEAHPVFLELKIPIIIYATIIMIMVLTTINRFERVSQESFRWVTLGALLFMFSDTCIALSRFTSFFEGKAYLASFVIMTLYGTGQYLIVKGALLQNENT
ncbi:MAG: lysoplasmalogenase [Chitinophagales bacterium]